MYNLLGGETHATVPWQFKSLQRLSSLILSLSSFSSLFKDKVN